MHLSRGTNLLSPSQLPIFHEQLGKLIQQRLIPRPEILSFGHLLWRRKLQPRNLLRCTEISLRDHIGDQSGRGIVEGLSCTGLLLLLPVVLEGTVNRRRE